jgi:hypothetical protein
MAMGSNFEKAKKDTKSSFCFYFFHTLSVALWFIFLKIATGYAGSQAA